MNKVFYFNNPSNNKQLFFTPIIIALILVCVLVNTNFAYTAEKSNTDLEQGFNIIKTYSAKEIGFGTQNFCIIQGREGKIFAGNLHGVIIYDGAKWSLVKLPNESAVLALKVTKKGKILVGGIGELGYLKKNKFNQFEYISLKNKIPKIAQNLGRVNKFFSIGEKIIIFTKNFLFELNENKFKILKTLRKDKVNPNFFIYNKKLYMQTSEKITQVENDSNNLSLKKLPSSKIFSQLENNNILMKDGTIYNTDNKQNPNYLLNLEKWLTGTRISSICQIPEKILVIGNRDKGIAILNQTTKQMNIINIKVGLPANDVRDIVLTKDGFLWIVLDLGIAKINISSPISIFDKRTGIIDRINCVLRYNKTLYIGVSSGLHFIEPVKKQNNQKNYEFHFSRIKKIKGPKTSIWSFVTTYDNNLIVGSGKGIYILKNNKLDLIANTKNLIAYYLKESMNDKKVIYVGCQQGLALLRQKNNKWAFDSMVPGMPPQIRSVFETKKYGFWVCSTFKGAWLFESIKNNEQKYHPKLLKKIGEGEAFLFEFQDDICFNFGGSAYIYNQEESKLEPHPILETKLSILAFYYVLKDKQSNYWFNTTPLSKINFSKNGSVQLDNFSYRNIQGIDYQSIYLESNGIIWVVSDAGLIKIKNNTNSFKTNLFTPQITDVYYGTKLLPINNNLKLSIPNSSKRMRFEFASMNCEPNALYQYKLEPVEDNWSKWSKVPFAEYTNLWEGDYKFKIRIQRKNNLNNEAYFDFTVHPPYYRTYSAYTFYFFIFIFAIWTFVKWRSYRLEKKANLLEANVKEKTSKLKLANKQLEEAKLQVEKNNLKLIVANAKLQNLSTKDGLTGIDNRRKLDQFLEEEWTRATRSQTPTSAILFDIDFFKKFNDSLGHLEGDKCLKSLATLLKNITLRKNDIVARYGGEEFTVVLPNCKLERALKLAEIIRNAIENLAIPHSESPIGKVTASFGVACLLATKTNNSLDLLKKADEALYRAKSKGRNRVEK